MTCIGKSIVIRGDVISAEDLAIDGHLEGHVQVPDHCLTIGIGAAVKADVTARTITIRGVVTGSVTASERIQIRETGSVDGDINVPRFAMVDGATLRGSVTTGPLKARAQDDEMPYRQWSENATSTRPSRSGN
jgi:cytoskeletal protein CcmA (bactofilin family)